MCTIIKNELKSAILSNLEILVERYPSLHECRNDILQAYFLLEEAFISDRKLLIAGNGGSAADSEHIVGELMKGFKKQRVLNHEFRQKLLDSDKELGKILGDKLQGALTAIALDGHSALTTACINDCDPLLCFAQQLNGYGKSDDIFLGISTSGNSKNVIYAAVTARAKGMKVIGLTGANKSRLESLSDVCIRVPETETYKIQELHLPVYHCICLMLEERFFGDNN